jgi:hypothetical protein
MLRRREEPLDATLPLFFNSSIVHPRSAAKDTAAPGVIAPVSNISGACGSRFCHCIAYRGRAQSCQVKDVIGEIDFNLAGLCSYCAHDMETWESMETVAHYNQ